MPRWIEEEIKTLNEMWENLDIGLDDMIKVLKTRTPDAIRRKAAELKLPPISEREKPKIDQEYYRKLMEVVEG